MIKKPLSYYLKNEGKILFVLTVSLFATLLIIIDILTGCNFLKN